MRSSATDQEVMDALSELTFGRKNAEELLLKIGQMAKAGNIRGFKPKQPHGGLWLLIQGYQARSSEFSKVPCLLAALTPAGHIGSVSNNVEKIADLYYAGKLDRLIQAARTSSGKSSQKRL
jgi:hypothetical protein